jgi:hypothetical protein
VATLSAPPVAGGAAIPGADSTANANGYDGYLTVQADPAQSGYVKRVNLTGANAIIGANTTASTASSAPASRSATSRGRTLSWPCTAAQQPGRRPPVRQQAAGRP